MSGAWPRLDLPLVLEAAERIGDGAGGAATRWAPLAILWAELRAVGSGERLAGAVIAGAVSHRMTIRAMPRQSPLWPTRAHRLRTGERVFAIRGVAERDGSFLTLWVDEEVAL